MLLNKNFCFYNLMVNSQQFKIGSKRMKLNEVNGKLTRRGEMTQNMTVVFKTLSNENEE